MKCKRCGKDPAAEIHTCTPTQEYRDKLLIDFVKDAYLRSCCIIESENCLSCRAKDVLHDLGELSNEIFKKKTSGELKCL